MSAVNRAESIISRQLRRLRHRAPVERPFPVGVQVQPGIVAWQQDARNEAAEVPQPLAVISEAGGRGQSRVVVVYGRRMAGNAPVGIAWRRRRYSPVG